MEYHHPQLGRHGGDVRNSFCAHFAQDKKEVG